MPSTSLSVDRYVLAAAVILTCILFTEQAADPVNVIKLTALMLCALVLLASASYRVMRYRVLHFPTVAVATAGLLAVAVVVATVTAPVTSTAVVGTYGRNSGLLAYSSALVLFLASARTLQRPRTAVVVGAVVLAGLFTSTYGLLQKAGLDAIPWNNPFNPIIAALGNPNFASGYLGIAASVATGAALWRGWAWGWRAASGLTSVLCLLTAALSDSVQGPIAASVGLALVALALTLDLTSRRRVLGLAGLAATGALGATVLLLGAVAKAGPASAIFSDVGSEARVHYWAAALDMFRDHPVLGVGLDHYGNYWRTSRSVESVELLGGPSFSDAAHSVPLQFLAQGGLLLAAAYALFVGAVAITLVRGLRRLQGPDRMLLATVGAGWAAYQVQSFVSIDQIPLIVLHFVLAGAVIAVAGGHRLREVRLPGAPKPVIAHPNDARTRRRVAQASPEREMNGIDLVVITSVSALCLVGAWFALVPLRANIAVHDGDALLTQGKGNAALAEYDRATNLMPGISVYWTKTGAFYGQVGQPALALRALEIAVSHDPFDVNAIRSLAVSQEAAGDLDAARQSFERAVALDPVNSATLVAAATFELRHAGAEQARSLLSRAVERLPGDADLWATLGDARAVLGDPAGARQAYERALQLNPDSQVAKEGIEETKG